MINSNANAGQWRELAAAEIMFSITQTVSLILCQSMDYYQYCLYNVTMQLCKYGLTVNAEKTKVLAISGTSCNINISSTHIKQVDGFSYLRSLITEDSNCCVAEPRQKYISG